MVYIETQHVDHGRASSGPLEKKQKKSSSLLPSDYSGDTSKRGGKGEERREKENTRRRRKNTRTEVAKTIFYFFLSHFLFKRAAGTVVPMVMKDSDTLLSVYEISMRPECRLM